MKWDLQWRWTDCMKVIVKNKLWPGRHLLLILIDQSLEGRDLKRHVHYFPWLRKLVNINEGGGPANQVQASLKVLAANSQAPPPCLPKPHPLVYQLVSQHWHEATVLWPLHSCRMCRGGMEWHICQTMETCQTLRLACRWHLVRYEKYYMGCGGWFQDWPCWVIIRT